MNDQVILVIGTSKFLMTNDEAFSVANVLNGCNRITQKWAKGGNVDIIGDPTIDAAYIVPMTAHLQIKLSANMKEDEK